MLKLTALTAVTAIMVVPINANAEKAYDGFTVGGNVALTKNETNNPISGANIGKIDKQGKEFRIFAGHNATFADRIVVGGEIGFSSGGPTINWSNNQYSYQANPKLGYDASLRSGILIGEKALVYGRVGYGNVAVKTTTLTPVSTAAVVNTKRKGGLVLGGGLEFSVSDKLSFRGEYLKKDFDDLDVNQFMLGAALRL